jgi:hypothetical protein
MVISVDDLIFFVDIAHRTTKYVNVLASILAGKILYSGNFVVDFITFL